MSWQFRIDRGRRAGDWSRIPVPSQWELQGFGAYAYGLDDPDRRRHAETGLYRHRFEVPAAWSGRRVRLVFEGVMTDASVRINGRKVGPTHRGGFTRFTYDVTDRLEYGAPNLLEIEVREASTDRTVNGAEREADYWLFGGIYRPVYLEARPERSIEHVSIDARHGGELRVQVELSGVTGGEEVRVTVRDPVSGHVVGPALAGRVEAGRDATGLGGRMSGVRSWSAERPYLYRLEATLADAGKRLHATSLSFGFRTIEVRPGEGLFVNDRRVRLRGVNRHSFWPDSGRALSAERNRRDVEIVKGLNANAVRTSHYPPDREFLEACDELGLYVIDELPGWHDAYRAGVGSRLISEMVRRDLNHPSVILWANGNEGGWNSLLDNEFKRHDLQSRTVIHPGSIAGGINATHYPDYATLEAALGKDDFLRKLGRLGRPRSLVLPTEMLHGLYDGGGGAGLEAYWSLLEASPLGVGGFLWSLFDEGVVRTDLEGTIDTRGSYAPDGIFGPFREPEASVDTVRRLWAPVRLEEADWSAGRVRLGNGHTETNLSELRFRWQGVTFPGPGSGATERIVFEQESPGPDVEPGLSGELRMSAMPDVLFHALRLTALHPSGRTESSWSGWSLDPASLLAQWLKANDRQEPPVRSRPSWIAGPEPVAIPGAGSMQKRDLIPVWESHASGWVRLEVAHSETGGFSLDFPNFEIETIEWLGDGPGPVWANRLVGPSLGVWRRALDDPAAAWRGGRGFYRGVRWIRFQGATGIVTLAVEPEDLYLGVSLPGFPAGFPVDAGNARAEMPTMGTLSLVRRIPAIGTKFHRAERLGPEPPRDNDPKARRIDVVWLKLDPR